MLFSSRINSILNKPLDPNKQEKLNNREKQSTQPKNPNYKKPPINLLSTIKNVDQSQDKALIQKNKEVLESTFKSFGVIIVSPPFKEQPINWNSIFFEMNS